MPENDAWDWPLLLYVGITVLGLPEWKFWRYTPRKFYSLYRTHIDIESRKSGNSDETSSEVGGYIDQVF